MEVRLFKLTKDTKFITSDYYFAKKKDFDTVYPYLMHKICGNWVISLIDLKVSEIESILDVDLGATVQLCIYSPAAALDALVIDYPELAQKQETFKEAINNYISTYPHTIAPEALKEMIHRLGKSSAKIIQYLEAIHLKIAPEDVVSLKIVRDTVPKQQPIYAKTVVSSFLNNQKNAWSLLHNYEKMLGTTIAYYAMYKYIRKLFAEKCKYLRNEEIKDYTVASVDAYSIIELYKLFVEHPQPNQLIIILRKFERRSVVK